MKEKLSKKEKKFIWIRVGISVFNLLLLIGVALYAYWRLKPHF